MRANLTPKSLALGIHTLITAGDTLSGPIPHALDIWPHLIHTHPEGRAIHADVTVGEMEAGELSHMP